MAQVIMGHQLSKGYDNCLRTRPHLVVSIRYDRGVGVFRITRELRVLLAHQGALLSRRRLAKASHFGGRAQRLLVRVGALLDRAYAPNKWYLGRRCHAPTSLVVGSVYRDPYVGAHVDDRR